jgi:4,4'-diaponeurosporenoate glycosyltransferase
LENYLIVIYLIAIICFLSGFYFLFRIPVCKIYSNNLEYPGLTIIIPSRNEEHNIGKLLDSINKQTYKAQEIIVVNDESTDKTKEIALEKGAIVIDSKPLPEGWLGKPWACYQGAQMATGELFIFLDSDVEIEESGLQKMMDSFVHFAENTPGKNIVMSIAPFHRIKEIYEELSAIFNIIMMGSMNAFTPFRNAGPTGLFGQSLIVSKENYFKINGHESVRNHILENMFMAEKFKEEQISLKCLGGKGSLSFRMYSNGLRELVDGWSKAFASGAAQIPVLSLINIILWISGGFIIFILFIKSIIDSEYLYYSLILYTGFSVQMLGMLKRIGSFRLVSSFLYPFHFIFFCTVFTRSMLNKLLKKKIQWKSRNV